VSTVGLLVFLFNYSFKHSYIWIGLEDCLEEEDDI
jgi:hypothetical protein